MWAFAIQEKSTPARFSSYVAIRREESRFSPGPSRIVQRLVESTHFEALAVPTEEGPVHMAIDWVRWKGIVLIWPDP